MALEAEAFGMLPFEAVVLDSDGVIVAANEAWHQFGLTRGLSAPVGVGTDYLEACEAAEGDPIAQAVAVGLRELLEGDRERFQYEYPCHEPGDHQWFELDARAFSHDGQRMGIVTHADVTDRKVAELEVESREEQLDVVRRLLTHDLRNPLSVIVGRLDQLEAEYGESDHLAAIRDATDRLYALGEHAPGFTTIDPKTEAEQLPFGPVARMAWDAVDPKGATLTVESDGHLLANKESLTLVLEGLFEHVSARSGSTRVWTGWLEDGFFVEDDGLELSEEELTAIHHTDFRSNSPTSIEWGLVRTVLAAQDWALEIEDGRDGGTRFEVVDVGFTVE